MAHFPHFMLGLLLPTVYHLVQRGKSFSGSFQRAPKRAVEVKSRSEPSVMTHQMEVARQRRQKMELFRTIKQ